MDLTNIMLNKASHKIKYILFDSVYIKHKSRINEAMPSEVRLHISFGGGKWKRVSPDTEEVIMLFLHLIKGYTSVFSL